jgi:hypothetical protein
VLAFLRESAHTVPFLSVLECEMGHRRWLMHVRNVFCLTNCVHLQGDKKHSKSLVDSGVVHDKAWGTQNFQKSRGHLKILGSRRVT